MQVRDRFESVLVGCLLGGHLRIWLGDGQPRLLRCHDVAALTELVANGVASRMSPEERRFREVALYDDRSQTLIVSGRFPTATDGGTISLPMRDFACEAVDELHTSAELWLAACGWFGRAFLSACVRGEFLVVERGAWEMIAVPYALGRTTRDGDRWVNAVEAAPAPLSALWRDTDLSKPGWTLTAPATPDSVFVAGRLMADAVSRWSPSPFDVVLTFGTNPDGPWNGSS
jgi:hypothetical protein